MYMYVYVYMCMCMCMCMCLCENVYVCVCMCVCMHVCVNSVIYKVFRVRQNCCWDWKDGERTVRRAKSGETLVEASRDTDAQIVRYTFFMGAKDKSNHLTAGSFQRFPQGYWSLIVSSGKANAQRNREHVVLDLFSNL